MEGEPGAGRTAFVREALAQAAALGCRVRYAAADALAVDLPLRAVLDCVHPAGPARAAVVGLLREAEAATEPGGALLAAMDLLTAGVEEWCAQRPLLLVLDDAHWADAASLLLWRRLAGTAATGRLPLMLAATRRPLPRRPGAERLCAAVGGRTVRLEPLTAAESAELIRDLVGAPPGPRLREAAEQAGGNPRLLRELLAQWSGLVRVEAGCAELSVPVAELPAPPASLGRGLDWLSGPARTTLRHAALLGPSFTAHELALVQARPARELLADLEEPLLAGLLEDTGDLLRFRHPALRRVLSAETPGRCARPCTRMPHGPSPRPGWIRRGPPGSWCAPDG